MTFMHGARRRLESSIGSHNLCSKIPFTVCTIDSFALSLVNRWRSALGIEFPVLPAPAGCEKSFERHSRSHLTFEDIANHATQLLKKSTVARIVGSSYPLVIIDEFQDCTEQRLELVKALSEECQLILAADPFQLLQSNTTSCPAAEWIETFESAKGLEHHQLTEPHRFSANLGIFAAARAVRDNVPLQEPTITVHCGPASPAAWWMMERLLLGWYGPRWSGNTAIISPSGGGVIDDVLQAMSEHAVKRGCKPICWARQSTSEEEQAALQSALGVTRNHLDEDDWHLPAEPVSTHASEIIDNAQRFVELRGLRRIPKYLIAAMVERSVHTARSQSRSHSRFVVTTIHGAKNREFDNVIVVWSYRIPPDRGLQRRLLYNAISRAKINCVVFDTRKKSVVINDPIIGLLNCVKPIFHVKPKSAKSKSTTLSTTAIIPKK